MIQQRQSCQMGLTVTLAPFCLPPCLLEGNAKFQLEVSEHKVVFLSHPSSQTPS